MQNGYNWNNIVSSGVIEFALYAVGELAIDYSLVSTIPILDTSFTL
jgi:hypothetical protein